MHGNESLENSAFTYTFREILEYLRAVFLPNSCRNRALSRSTGLLSQLSSNRDEGETLNTFLNVLGETPDMHTP